MAYIRKSVVELVEMEINTVISVEDLPQSSRLELVTDSQDVEEIMSRSVDWWKVEDNRYDFSSLYVLKSDGDYDAIFGMAGIIPHNHKAVTKLA